MAVETALFLVVGWFGLLLVALHNRWLSRFRQGFVVTLFASLVSVAVCGPLLIASWSYHAGKSMLTGQIEQQLSDTGEIIRAGIMESTDTALEQMGNASRMLITGETGQLRTSKIADALADTRAVNPLFLHMHLFDSHGQLKYTSRGDRGPEKSLADAIATVLRGERYQRGPFYSAELDKTIMQFGVPVKTSGDRVAGALLAQFDLESRLQKRFSKARFGKTGYVILADSRGRIISHPDASRNHNSVADYQSTRAALDGKDGFVLETRNNIQPTFFFYRSIRNASVAGSETLALLTELSQEEAVGPARTILHRFALVLIVMVVATILVVTQLARYVRRPVYELLDNVNRIKDGDLKVRVAVHGQDEIGRLGQALNDMAAGLQERDRIRDIFGRYVTKQISERILRQDISPAGEAREVTVLFSDIRDFTAMSESMNPGEVVDFLNDYFSEMVDAVFEFGGVLDKYIGDGMMALFGSLDDAPDHACRAVRTALRMKTHLESLNAERVKAGKPEIRIGIGIHTDVVVVGSIGSRHRLEYTAVGDGVNTASRLEGLNKQFGTTILISGNTHQATCQEFDCRSMPDAVLKGKSRTVTIYEVVGAIASKMQGDLKQQVEGQAVLSVKGTDERP